MTIEKLPNIHLSFFSRIPGEGVKNIFEKLVEFCVGETWRP